MEYVEHAPLLPRSCFLCGQANGPFVDLQRDDEDNRVAVGVGDVTFGSIFHYYVCARCAVSMAQMVAPAINITVVNTDQYDELTSRAALAEGRLDEMMANNADLRAAIQIVQSQPPAPAATPAVYRPEVDTDSEPTPAPKRTPRKAAAKK